ncbi:MAG: hypothetical protein F7B61_03815 [Caldisphaeraceae archaeon]|nr:hypothetical protein [Caldisphaeraceae archaeon]
MKVAVPSYDCKTMAFSGPGTGQFLVLNIEGGRIIGEECRKVNAERPEEDEDESGPEHARWHLAILETLKDVDAIVARHMGETIMTAFKALKKKIITGVYFENVEQLIDFLIKEGILKS